MVSYMCQSQLSSPMLPSAAPTPPCAATVCDRVGNTFESTATRSPACASSSDARMPEPPAPTITATNFRTGIVIALARPQDGCRPDQVEEERHHHRELQCEADAGGLDVVHEDVAHPDPRVVEQRHHEEHGRDAHERPGEKRPPVGVRGGRVPQEAHEQAERV